MFLYNYLGCDSIRVLKLTVNNCIKTLSSFTKQICSFSSFWNHNATGYYDSIFKVGNCDSIVTLHLIVDKYIKDSINISICFDSSYQGHSTSQIYFDTLISGTFCDTIRRINLTVKPKLTPKLINDKSICIGDTLQLYPGKFDFYLWNNGGKASKIIVKNVGNYWVKVSDSSTCSAIDSFTLISLDTLPKDFLPTSLNMCLGEQFTLNGYKNYSWSTGETTPTINLNGLNSYWLKVTNSKSCVGSDTMKIIYLNTQNISTANAFSPNGDGINDEFKPLDGVCIISYKLNVYSRWGQLVYTSQNANKAWNGTLNGNGKPLPIDVYFYILDYISTIGESIKKSGSITLLR